MRTQARILDQWGRPIERKVLTQEVAAASITGVRSPITGYPGDGLNPQRLATILREADAGDPLRYLELAETIEERDLHYVGVLGTRRRSVSQIEISVEAASDSAEDVARADMVRDWLTRDELADELFDILDAIGKGWSFTEIIWDTSEGQWRPARLEWRDPRWFRPDRHDLTTPMMIADDGAETPLPGGKFIAAIMRAKSGVPVRGGLARIAAWAWMFKAFTNRDWAIFTQTFGQPIRVGKYGPGATEGDRATLYRAVANIAGDCAAIMPEGMSIEFIESGSIGASMKLYEERADWLDRQVSKAVLGQTTTTDAISGGHAVSQEHRQVQEDIERADARALSAVVNRDLIRVWMDLEFGPQKTYPRIRIARPEKEDLAALSSSLASLVPLGLRVSASEVRDRFGLAEPDAQDEVLEPRSRPAAPPQGEPGAPEDAAQSIADLHHQRSAGSKLPEEIIADAVMPAAAPAVAELVERVRGFVARAGSLEEAERILETVAGRELTPPSLIGAMRQAMLLAWLQGEAAEMDLGSETALQSRKGFDPDQPRVPKGQETGGEWTDDPAWVGDSYPPNRDLQDDAAVRADLRGVVERGLAEYDWIGLRIDDYEVQQVSGMGGLLPPSRVWDDGNVVEGAFLDGTSAIGIASLDDLEKAVGAIGYGTHPAGGYFGRIVYVVGSHETIAGQDPGERVFKDATTLAAYERETASSRARIVRRLY